MNFLRPEWEKVAHKGYIEIVLDENNGVVGFVVGDRALGGTPHYTIRSSVL